MRRFALNDVVKLSDPAGGRDRLIRLVHFDDAGRIGVIELDNDLALPHWIAKVELEAAFESNVAERGFDTVTKRLRRPRTEAEKRAAHEAFEFAQALVSSHLDDLFDRHGRAAVLNAVVSGESDIRSPYATRHATLKIIRRHLQGGMHPHIHVPAYRKRGGSGRRILGASVIGRPPVYGTRKSFNMTEEDRAWLREAVKKYYFGNPHNSLRDAVDVGIGQIFATSFEIRDGVAYPVYDPAQVPSLRQARSVKDDYVKEIGYEKAEQLRKGEHRHLLTGRATEGRAADLARHQAIMQIDAAQVPIELVSEDRKRLIGDGYMYIITNVRDGYIVSVSYLPGPGSYLGLMQALEISIQNKVEFCAEYGITITENEWFAEHQPEVYMTDLGPEFTSDDLKRAMKDINSEIDFTGRARPDMKGIVEAIINTVKSWVKDVPGAWGRTEDTRKSKAEREAGVTPSDLMEMLITIVMAINHSSWRGRAAIDFEMAKAGVPFIPHEMFMHNLAYHSGALRRPPYAWAKKCYTPTVEATVTKRGIKFPGLELHYTCKRAVDEAWFSQARVRGHRKVTLAYDPRNISTAFLVDEATDSWEPCQLTKGDKDYEGWCLQEVRNYDKALKDNEANSASRRQKARVDAQARKRHVINRANRDKKEGPRRRDKDSKAANRQQALNDMYGASSARDEDQPAAQGPKLVRPDAPTPHEQQILKAWRADLYEEETK